MSWNLTRQSSKLQSDITESQGTCCRVCRKPNLEIRFLLTIHFPQHIFFTSTSRTKPFGPGKTWRILPTFHFPLIGFWSATMTELFTFTFLLWVLHFFHGMSWGRTSLYHLFQKATTIFWQNSSRWRGFSMWWNGPLGTLLVALPSMMSFGHKSSGSFGILPMGRSFNRFATSRRQV